MAALRVSGVSAPGIPQATGCCQAREVYLTVWHPSALIVSYVCAKAHLIPNSVP